VVQYLFIALLGDSNKNCPFPLFMAEKLSNFGLEDVYGMI